MNKMNSLLHGFLCILFVVSSSISSEPKAFSPISGPMVGYTGMREVQIWTEWPKSKQPISVQIQYRDKEKSKNPSSSYHLSQVFEPKHKSGTLTIPLTLLEPSKTYEYKILVNQKEIAFDYALEFKTKPLWQWRKDPPDVRFAIGSCNYINDPAYDRPGKIYGSGYEIFASIQKDQPEFFVWMGDNVYLREADWDSESGISYRYSHTRRNREMQSMLASMFHIATWDDHDFGPNDASSSYGFRDSVERIFREYWPDPSYPKKGLYRSYTWSDIEFFLLDNRTFRTANTNFYDLEKPKSFQKSKGRSALGRKQKEWLFNALSDSQSKIKFIVLGGQFINSAQVYENLSNYEEDRNEILDFIHKMKISGVIFLSGDRHHSEISRLDRGNIYPIYEWTISPLTAGLSSTTQSEPNQYRIPDSYILDRVYGLIEITGIGKDRMIRLTTKNTYGKELYKFEIPLADLKKTE
ncbi:MAG: alkaline phosphatase D family protein [Leptospiraceae bacterium]|nr:alkaline phosphatase D family protein [Leptospiraceae bacterium]MCZ8347002.1 alkaline phosphatase D family protein [Leptospiraceae bacterium]